MPRTNIPSYRLHKPTGQAIVSLRGKIFYLGKYKSKASREKYTELIAEYTSNGCNKLPPICSNSGVLIENFAFQYLKYAEKYYVKDGVETDSFRHCKYALAPVIHCYGRNSVSNFGPLALVFIRDKWVDEGTARKTINRWVNAIRQMFQWGVAHELVDSLVLHVLQAVSHLKLGRIRAAEYKKISPVADEIVEKTLPFCPPIIRDMIQVQRLAGLRPQDVRNLRSCDIDKSGDVLAILPVHPQNTKTGKIPRSCHRAESPDNSDTLPDRKSGDTGSVSVFTGGFHQTQVCRIA